jgi:MFS family permease
MTAAWSPWRTVLTFGYVSLAADMVYEGMRSASGPLLLSLGASAFVVGLVTGAGEAIALGLRLVSGPLADRTGRHWQLTVQGYVLTAVSVPLLAITPFLGAAGLIVASALIILERTGKAVRSPSKSTLLARMAEPVGRGRGFAVHKALDQVGAFAGPLLVAGLAAVTGHLWAGFAILAIPGIATLILLALLRQGTNLDQPTPGGISPPSSSLRSEQGGTPSLRGTADDHAHEPAGPLPRSFWAFSISCACSTLGLMTFGVMSVHLVRADLVTAALVPVVYAGAMAVQAIAALGSGFAYDSIGPRILYALPLLVAAVPALVFADGLGVVLLGISVWALATAVQDSTVKALVADLVPGERLATSYGVFATAQGLGALGGGALAGGLYEQHLGLLIAIIATLQAAALVTLVITVQTARRRVRHV